MSWPELMLRSSRMRGLLVRPSILAHSSLDHGASERIAPDAIRVITHRGPWPESEAFTYINECQENTMKQPVRTLGAAATVSPASPEAAVRPRPLGSASYAPLRAEIDVRDCPIGAAPDPAQSLCAHRTVRGVARDTCACSASAMGALVRSERASARSRSDLPPMRDVAARTE